MTETLKYSILQESNWVELRQYPAHILVQVNLTEKSYRKAIYQGFRPLADYIFGQNQPAEKIAMTSPVAVSRSTKIAMTSPVTVSGDGDYTVSFIMPAEYTLETLPKPKNPDVIIKKIKESTMAVIQFRGFFNKRKINKAKKHLIKYCEKESLRPIGEFVVAGYDPPWVPGFLAHNEVMVEVEEVDKQGGD